MTNKTAIVHLSTTTDSRDRLFDHYQTAQLAQVTTRSLLKYWRYGLICPNNRCERYGIYFEEEAIYKIRKAESIRLSLKTDIAAATTILKLAEENEELRNEIRFLRGI